MIEVVPFGRNSSSCGGGRQDTGPPNALPLLTIDARLGYLRFGLLSSPDDS